MGQGGIEREGWIAAGAGLVLALLVFSVPLLDFVFSYFLVLVHEMGHSFFYWLYGYPSIPAFDFVYGGGLTSHQQRIPLLVLAVQGMLGAVAWVFRRNPLSLGLSLLIGAAYALTAWTPLHRPLILAMGHGSELVFATVFLHRALSGNACHHRAERWLYGCVGFFVVLFDLRFARRLMQSSFHRELYEQAKGGGHWMDFSVLAERELHVPLETVAAAFLVLCLLPPLVSFAVNRHRAAVSALLVRLLQTESRSRAGPDVRARGVSRRGGLPHARA